MDSKQRIKELTAQIAAETDVIKLRTLIQNFQVVVSESSLGALNRAFYLSHMPIEAGVRFSTCD